MSEKGISYFTCDDVSNPHPIPQDSRSFASHYLDEIAKYPNSWMVETTTGKRMSLAELSDRIQRVSSGLLRRGYTKGDKVVLLARNCIDFTSFLIGCSLSHVVVSPANPAYTGEELLHQVNFSESVSIVVRSELIPVLENCLELARQKGTGLQLREIFIFDPTNETPSAIAGVATFPFEELVDKSDTLLQAQTSLDPKCDPWIMPFSSGTTGLPKGVVLTHYNMLANVKQFHPYENLFGAVEGDTILGVLPMYHIYGLIMFSLLGPMQGANVVLLPAFEPVSFLESVEKFQVTHIYIAPPLALFLAKDPRVSQYSFASVKDFVSAAAPLSPEMAAAAAQRIRDQTGSAISFRQGWGMTELSPIGTMGRRDGAFGVDNFAHIGQVLPFTEAKLISPENGETVAVGEEGELCIRGPQVMKEYFKNPESTASTINSEGWLMTGDIAKANEKGQFLITDRLKELIKTKGFQVAPAELEGIILSHPQVQDCCVIGVPHPYLGEAPFAAVVPKPGQTLTEKQITDLVKGKVASYKQLSGGVTFVDTIPKSASGKLLRRIIRARFL